MDRLAPQEVGFGEEAGAAARPLAPATRLWLGTVLGLVAVALAHSLMAPARRPLPDIFFYDQDLGVVGVFGLALVALGLAGRRGLAWAPAASWRTTLLMATAVTALAWAGSHLIYDGYALSMDEFMARFDAQILASGRLAAPVAPEWRGYLGALQPIFRLDFPGDAHWVSNYLPVNAAFLALGLRLGAENLVPALWAGVSVLAVFGVARRLWPERPGAALVAAALLATSPQLLITAMTPYAMSAHLALNLVWLWLFLRGGRLGHGLAAGVAFLATGLHQIVFHPLFAAPFVLELWLARRWKPALWHSLAYLAIGAFWALYQPLLLQLYGATPVAAAAHGHGALAMLRFLLGLFDPAGVGYLAKNLIRFITWQNVLLAPLALVATIPAVRAGGMLRALALGGILTLGLLFVVMPYQGHGWGYRYLHGLMGSFALLAAWSWTRLVEAPGFDASARRAVFAAGLVVTLGFALPLRAIQAHAFEHPYAMAERKIQAMDADVVLVQDAGLWFGVDLVRNDPLFEHPPRVLLADALRPEQLQQLCRRARVAWFLPSEAVAEGVPHVPAPPSRPQGCGTR